MGLTSMGGVGIFLCVRPSVPQSRRVTLTRQAPRPNVNQPEEQPGSPREAQNTGCHRALLPPPSRAA